MNVDKGDTIGFIVGGVAGYLLGKKFGPKSHATASKVVGAIVGSLAGVQIGDKIYTQMANAQLAGGAATPVALVASGTTTVSVKSGTPVQISAPAPMQFLSIDGQNVLGGAVASYGPATLPVGTHQVAGQWNDSGNVTHQGNATITVTP